MTVSCSTGFRAIRCRGLTKLKIPLQLYDCFVLNKPNRPRGLTKLTISGHHKGTKRAPKGPRSQTAAAVGWFFMKFKIFDVILKQSAAEG